MATLAEPDLDPVAARSSSIGAAVIGPGVGKLSEPLPGSARPGSCERG